MALIYKLSLILLVALFRKSVASVENNSQLCDKSLNEPFGYELMQERMDNLQFSFLELFVHVKELGELMVNNQRAIEQNQMETNNMMRFLENKLAANVSVITGYSKQILEYQTICANHDEIKKEMQRLKPQNVHIQNISTIKVITESESIKSCQEARSKSTGLFEFSGIEGVKPFKVLCQMEKFDGGWLVFQRRFNGSVDFYRNWTEYRDGFGDISGEFWLGLERVHQLTKEGKWELLVEMTDFQGNYKYARYSEFSIGGESEKYALTKLGSYSGTAEDHLTFHKGQKFSTFDQDNDGNNKCAVTHHGAWWYKNCYKSNLNGLHANIQETKAIKWYSGNPSLKNTWMMIRKV